ncbi:hypothetical protein BDY17DRAFT_246659 [Neohortaea acidophila]|uniref:Synaptobrevin n=1 Tax=Neohortaea acidophila TaxID=245834 RepID=A0A6A6Q347_9PEZI|nr:uncharacterized protein BDY17DRAFT_246659 [Neohortaea acidophila]KAF2486715.1 hypothetical protein BDY17DRAFT_246659 [Neohortaea acidophila]
MDPASTVTLNRLLSRLDSTLLQSSDASQLARLRGSQYERNKVASNVEYARTLLLTLEKQSSTIRVQTQRQQAQADLQQKRELIKRLNARLLELNQLGDEEFGDDDSEEDEEEGIKPSYAPARIDAKDGLDTGDFGSAPEPEAPPDPPLQPPDLRARKPLQSSDNRDAASTTAREQLFSKSAPPSQSSATLPQTETLLSHNRTEQENLTSGLLSLARALKQSSLQFSSSLEAEKEVLKRAEGGLDKSAQGMEAAEKRMGLLRKMSEGQGWWGRMKLYAFIFGLWVACFLVVFIGPKLRF